MTSSPTAAPLLNAQNIVDLSFTTSSTPVRDGINLFVKTWHVPEGTPRKSVIIYNHGFAENTELYNEFLPHLAFAGHEVVVYDQRGAGQTSPGKLYALTNEDYVFSDLDTLIESVTKDYKGPLFLSGHSMGGSITLNYAIKGKHRDLITGYWAIAPMIVLHPKSQPNVFQRLMLRVGSAVAPNFRDRAPLAIDYITHDERWKKRFSSDEATRVVCSAGQMSDAIKRGTRLTDPDYVAKFVAGKPVAIFHSTTDYINDFAGSVTFFDLLPKSVPYKKLYRYTDMAHSLPHETPDRSAQVFHDILEYVDGVVDGSVGDN